LNSKEVYEVIKSAVLHLNKVDNQAIKLEKEINPDKTLDQYGFDIISFGELVRELEDRFDGRDLNLESFLIPENFFDLTIGQLCEHIQSRVERKIKNPIVVYVDDEEENLFIFKRKFGKDFNLKMFSDPKNALDYIASEPDVSLVITDEVMPGICGNQLCDEVRKIKPYIKFILITGNPEGDQNLMYKTLRGNRFYDFIQKPVDFDGKRDEYIKLIGSLLCGE